MTDPTEIVVPGDKSISHRALILSALATGRSTVRGALDSADTRSTADVLRSLGVAIPSLDRDPVRIEGNGLRGLTAPSTLLDCGNSGTTARLTMGVAAGCDFASRFDGDRSLRTRPMARVAEPLRQMGAHIRELAEPGRLPLEVRGGRLRDIDMSNEKSSAQVKSAMILAALVGGAHARVHEPIHSRDHTERLLDAMGVPVRTVVEAGGMCIEVDPVDALKPLELDVPRDFSSAAFFLARGLLAPPVIRIPAVGLNATRAGLLDVIRRMQGAVHVSDRRTSGSEPIGTLTAESGALHGVQVEAAEIPHMIDEVPILAILAARAEGMTVIRGAAELRVKETDRLKALAANLRAIGAHAEEAGDALIVTGTDAPLRGRVVTDGDHRIAMAFGILASIPGNEIELDDVACVSVSFPGFWQQLELCTT